MGIVGALWLVRLSRTPGESLIIDNIKQISIQNITKRYSKIKTSWTPACFFCWALGPIEVTKDVFLSSALTKGDLGLTRFDS